MSEKMKSRKFWMAMIGALLPILGSLFTGAVDLESAMKASSAVICTYMLGQGYTDGKTMEGWTPEKVEGSADGEA